MRLPSLHLARVPRSARGAVVVVPRSARGAFIVTPRSARAAVIVWIALLIAGVVATAAWENRRGSWDVSPSRFPPTSSLTLARHRFTLLLFAHPSCPCTLAAMHELERILSRRDDRISAQVILSSPADEIADGDAAELLKRARAIPGVAIARDPHCVEARAFGARTSGSVFLFEPSGRLVFRGGITGARGHEGDNAGEDAILAITDHRAADTNLPVFGCPLYDPASAPALESPHP
jgi:hypothetical protein